MTNNNGFSDMKDKEETRSDIMKEGYTTEPQHSLDYNDYDGYEELPEWAKKDHDKDDDIAAYSGTFSVWKMNRRSEVESDKEILDDIRDELVEIKRLIQDGS